MAASSGRLFRHHPQRLWVTIAYRTSTFAGPKHTPASSPRGPSYRRLFSSDHPSDDGDRRGNANRISSSSRSENSRTNGNSDARTTPGVDLQHVLDHYQVRRRGQRGHGSREYLLVPPDVDVDALLPLPPTTTERQPPPPHAAVVAALLAHRNVLFGARAFLGHDVERVGPALVREAIRDAGEYGEQPQAMAGLGGLSGWVEACLRRADGAEAASASAAAGGNNASNVLERLKETDAVAWEAVRAIATGIPRPGHSVVGAGTFRDGEEAWKALAREYVELGLAPEANLYLREGGRLVSIEHLADRNPDYLDSAGGAMARLFFL